MDEENFDDIKEDSEDNSREGLKDQPEENSKEDFRRSLWRKVIVLVVVIFLVFWSVARFYWWH